MCMQWGLFSENFEIVMVHVFKVSHSENDPHCWFLANRICLVGDYVMILLDE